MSASSLRRVRQLHGWGGTFPVRFAPMMTPWATEGANRGYGTGRPNRGIGSGESTLASLILVVRRERIWHSVRGEAALDIRRRPRKPDWHGAHHRPYRVPSRSFPPRALTWGGTPLLPHRGVPSAT